MLELCVNVSPLQARSPDLVGLVKGILRETGFPPGRLTLEITEQGLVENTEATDRTVKALKAFGVQLAIDDFGAYQAGLGYLRRWPMDMLKLDQTLVADLDRDERGRAIVAAVVGLAQSLGMGVTAEGIETAEQLARLRELGCNWGQGYFFTPPLSPDELVAFLRNGTAFLP
jgi:EAL domain-containing protein (putative c-di-GMP-specific phosphodiesterase class I)